MSPLHLTWAGPGRQPARARPDWPDAPLLHAATWMLFGLPVMYALVVIVGQLWSWLFGTVGMAAVLAVPAPTALILALGWGLYVEVPRTAWQMRVGTHDRD